MSEPEQIEELTFEEPAEQAPVLLNPDRFVERLVALGGGRGLTPGSKIRLRSTLWGKRLICIECVHGQHGQCSASECPCVHTEIFKPSDDRQPVDSAAEEYCWPV